MVQIPRYRILKQVNYFSAVYFNKTPDEERVLCVLVLYSEPSVCPDHSKLSEHSHHLAVKLYVLLIKVRQRNWRL
jgi:hypothetical protein